MAEVLEPARSPSGRGEATPAEQKRMDIRWWAAYKQVFKALHNRDTDPSKEFSGIAAAATDSVFKALGYKLW